MAFFGNGNAGVEKETSVPQNLGEGSVRGKNNLVGERKKNDKKKEGSEGAERHWRRESK